MIHWSSHLFKGSIKRAYHNNNYGIILPNTCIVGCSTASRSGVISWSCITSADSSRHATSTVSWGHVTFSACLARLRGSLWTCSVWIQRDFRAGMSTRTAAVKRQSLWRILTSSKWSYRHQSMSPPKACTCKTSLIPLLASGKLSLGTYCVTSLASCHALANCHVPSTQESMLDMWWCFISVKNKLSCLHIHWRWSHRAKHRPLVQCTRNEKRL